MVLFKLGQYQESLTDFDKTLELDPKFVYAYFGKGQTLVALGLYEQALDCFTKGEAYQ